MWLKLSTETSALGSLLGVRIEGILKWRIENGVKSVEESIREDEFRF
jgi:hypothetical protein